MARTAETLARLRQTIARAGPGDDRPKVPLGFPLADAALMGGLRRGALHEVYAKEPGDGATASGFVTSLTARIATCTKGWLFWIRQDYAALEHGELNGAGLAELGIDPARVLMLKVADVADALKASGDALACRGIASVVIETIGPSKLLDLTASRRLSLAAAEKGVTAILLRHGVSPEPSAAETRWLVHSSASPPHDDWGAPVFDATLARNRHGMCGQWTMEWCGDDRVFRAPANPFAVAPAAADGSDRAPPSWRHAI